MTSMLEPVDEGFLTSAPTRYSETFAIARPAGEVWGELVSQEPLHWCRILSVGWTSERPFGVGTTRQVKVLGGAMSLEEYFFIWEEGRRYAFYATQANLPLFRHVAEDYTVEPDGPDRCRFTWAVALEPTPLGRPGGRVNGVIFKRLFAETRRYFKAT
jgi:Polyketide cyclase / dehydrase and lipid transport